MDSNPTPSAESLVRSHLPRESGRLAHPSATVDTPGVHRGSGTPDRQADLLMAWIVGLMLEDDGAAPRDETEVTSQIPRRKQTRRSPRRDRGMALRLDAVAQSRWRPRGKRCDGFCDGIVVWSRPNAVFTSRERQRVCRGRLLHGAGAGPRWCRGLVGSRTHLRDTQPSLVTGDGRDAQRNPVAIDSRRQIGD